MYYFFLLLSFTFRLNVFDTCICVVYRKLYSNNNQKMRIYGKKNLQSDSVVLVVSNVEW